MMCDFGTALFDYRKGVIVQFIGYIIRIMHYVLWKQHAFHGNMHTNME